MAIIGYIYKKIDNELCLCRCNNKDILDYITMKELREVDDDLYDKIYNNRSNNGYVSKKFKQECINFFKLYKSLSKL